MTSDFKNSVDNASLTNAGSDLGVGVSGGECRDFVAANNDNIVCNDDYDLGTGPFTISCWYKGTHNSAYIGLMGNANAGAYWTLENNSGKVGHWCGGTLNTGSVSIINDAWHQCVMTRTSTTGRIYVDDSIDGSSFATSAANFTGAYSANIGSWGNATYSIDGLIDEARISNVERTASWIKADYYVCFDSTNDFYAEELMPVENEYQIKMILKSCTLRGFR